MAKNSGNQNANKTWVRFVCGALGVLMVAGVVFMLIQLLVG